MSDAAPKPDTKPAEAPPIYTPETPDALRDGLFRGFWAHRGKPGGKKE